MVATRLLFFGHLKLFFFKQTFCYTYMGPLSPNHSKKLELGPLVGAQGTPKFQGEVFSKIF